MLKLLGVWGRQAEDPANVQQDDDDQVGTHHIEDRHGGVGHTGLFLSYYLDPIDPGRGGGPVALGCGGRA